MIKKMMLFEPKREYFSLLISYALILFALIHYLFHGTQWNLSIYISIALIFSAHQTYNYIILLGTDGGRTWIKRKSGDRPWLFWLMLGSAFTLLFLLFLLVFREIPLNQEIYSPLYLSVILLTEGLIRPSHGVMQTFGLMRGYDYIIKTKSSGETHKVKYLTRTENTERKLFFYFLLMTILSRIAVILGAKSPSLTFVDWNKISLFLTVITLLLAIVIIIKSFYSLHAALSFKSHYLTRILLTATASISPISYSAERLLHGLEHHFVLEKMTYKNKKSGTKWAMLILILFTLLGLFLVSFKPHGILNLLGDPVKIPLVGSFYGSFAVLHVLLDRIMFRMNDPVTRETIGLDLWSD